MCVEWGMANTSAVSPNSSLSALRGAVGGVLGAADDLGCWDRVVSIWRIFLALDRLIAVLWAIVERLRAKVDLAGGVGPAKVAPSGRPQVGGSRPKRVRALSGRRPSTAVVVSVRRILPSHRPPVGCAWPGCDLGGISSVPAIQSLLFSELGWAAARDCAVFVTII